VITPHRQKGRFCLDEDEEDPDDSTMGMSTKEGSNEKDKVDDREDDENKEKGREWGRGG